MHSMTAWPRNKHMPTSVELFAGADGLGMGLSLAGFHHRAVVEWDRWACDTIRENQRRGHSLVANWPLHEGDVRAFNYQGLHEPIDVVAGGPPCQPFSLGGKHGAYKDDRDMFPAAAEVVRQLRRRAFIFENVKSLLRESFANYFGYVMRPLEFPEIVRKADETWQSHQYRIQQYKISGSRSGLCAAQSREGTECLCSDPRPSLSAWSSVLQGPH